MQQVRASSSTNCYASPISIGKRIEVDFDVIVTRSQLSSIKLNEVIANPATSCSACPPDIIKRAASLFFRMLLRNNKIFSKVTWKRFQILKKNANLASEIVFKMCHLRSRNGIHAKLLAKVTHLSFPAKAGSSVTPWLLSAHDF